MGKSVYTIFIMFGDDDEDALASLSSSKRFERSDKGKKEEAEMRKKEIEDFDKKVVGDNKHFYVNSLVKPSHQIDKH